MNEARYRVKLKNQGPDPRAELKQKETSALLDFSRAIADKVRAKIIGMKSAGFKVQCKEDGSPVTNIDKEVEKLIRAEIINSYPSHGIIGEELEDYQLEADFVWALDPIDGTEEFINGIPLYGSMLCLLYKHKPIVAVLEHPELNYRVDAAYKIGAYLNGSRIKIKDSSIQPAGQERIFTGAKKQFLRDSAGERIYKAIDQKYENQRVYYSCFGQAAVAAGAFDAGIEYGLNIWDSVPGMLICEEAGGACHIIQEALQEDGRILYGFVFGKERVVADIITVINAT